MDFLIKVLENIPEELHSRLTEEDPKTVAGLIVRHLQVKKLDEQAKELTGREVTSSSFGIGELGEDYIEKILTEKYGDRVIRTSKTAHSCDFTLDDISIEVKNYQTVVNTTQVEKFRSDVLKRNKKGGIIVSLRSSFVGGKRFHIVKEVDTDGVSRVYGYLAPGTAELCKVILPDMIEVVSSYIQITEELKADEMELHGLLSDIEQINNYAVLMSNGIEKTEKLRDHVTSVLDASITESRYALRMISHLTLHMKSLFGLHVLHKRDSSTEEIFTACKNVHERPFLSDFLSEVSKVIPNGKWDYSKGPYGTSEFSFRGSSVTLQTGGKKSKFIVVRDSLTEKLLSDHSLVIDSMTGKKIVVVFSVNSCKVMRELLST